MKKTLQYIFLACLPVFSFVSTTQAQKGFNAGINGNYSMSDVYDRSKYGDVPYNMKLKSGPGFGIAAGYNFNDRLGIEVEANYQYMGAKYLFVKNTPQNSEEFDLRYYQVPVLFKFTGGNYLNRFSSMVGPAFGFLNSARMTSDNGGYNGDAKSSFKSTDIGLMLSAGGDITIYKNLYINTALRVYYGMYTINNDPHAIMASSSENERLGNAYVGINLGIYNMFVKPEEAKTPTW